MVAFVRLAPWSMLRPATRNVCRRRLRWETSCPTEPQEFRFVNATGIQVILAPPGVMFRLRPAGVGVGVVGVRDLLPPLEVEVDGAGAGPIRNNATRLGRRELSLIFLVCVLVRTACTSPGMPMLPGTPVWTCRRVLTRRRRLPLRVVSRPARVIMVLAPRLAAATLRCARSIESQMGPMVIT